MTQHHDEHCPHGCTHNHNHADGHHEHHHEHHEHHEHHHEHHHDGDTHHQLWKIGLAALLLIAAVIVEHTMKLSTWQLLLCYLPAYLVAGHSTLGEAAEGIASGDLFNENFLMTVATLGALCIGFLPGAETEFPEAVFVMLFFQVGELFEGYAEGRSRESIAHLMDIRPDTAMVERGGEALQVEAANVLPGETIVVKPGERVPLDGEVLKGTSQLNTVALTGESLPRETTVGDAVFAGSVNLSGVLRIRVSKPYGESTASKIIELVEHAGEYKSRSETFITRFARVYTPVVVFAALALAILPPLFSGAFATTFPTWLHRALIFLVVSCPCALVLSIPLTFFGGIGGASRKGVLVKGGNHLDTLARTGTVVFDKTGTLTHGKFAVEVVHPEQCDERHLLHLAAHVEHFSNHPIGAALRDAFPEESTDGCRVEEVEEVAGQGVRALVEGHRVCVGNRRMMEAEGTTWSDCPHPGTIIHVAIDGEYAGHIAISDKVKADSVQTITHLREIGVNRVVMLTGDREEVAAAVASQLGIDEYKAAMLPTDKVEALRKIIANAGHGVAFVGDGINDAPVLAMADVGVAMGGLGSDAAIEAADVVLMDDQPSKLCTAIAIARRTLTIARENVLLAIGIKVAVLALATFGLATMWMAVFADVGVTVLAVLNAMRALRGAE